MATGRGATGGQGNFYSLIRVKGKHKKCNSRIKKGENATEKKTKGKNKRVWIKLNK